MKKHEEAQRTQPRLVRLVSLGCPKNTVDTGVAAGALLVDGFGLTADDAEADVMWINTCAFLLSARKEAMEEIRRACAWKKRIFRQCFRIQGKRPVPGNPSANTCPPIRKQMDFAVIFPKK